MMLSPQSFRRLAAKCPRLVRGFLHSCYTSWSVKITIYVDGFNLYYGCLKGSSHRWLDLRALAAHVGPKGATITVKYYTANISSPPGDPSAPTRQQIYHRALRATNVDIILGKFLSNTVRMPTVPLGIRVPVLKTEEKGTDVNIAAHLVRDAFRGDFDRAILITNDSDLIEPVRIVTQELGKPLTIYNPHRKHAKALASVATDMRHLRPQVLAASQLPPTLTDTVGVITKPATW